MTQKGGGSFTSKNRGTIVAMAGEESEMGSAAWKTSGLAKMLALKESLVKTSSLAPEAIDELLSTMQDYILTTGKT